MQDTWVRSLGWEDPLEKKKGTHSSILTWRIPWTVWAHKESDIVKWLSLHFKCISNGQNLKETVIITRDSCLFNKQNFTYFLH